MINKKDMKVSRFISFVLRHKPDTINLKLDEEGYGYVDTLIQGAKKQGYNISLIDLERIVEEDDKQRYSFNKDNTLIRANQGHSLSVNLKLKSIKPPDILYHGTAKKYLNSILENGLDRRSRQHVHLSSDLETAAKVGKRHGELVMLKIKAELMYREGFEFYLSDNNVWLTNKVPKEYIEIIG